MAARNIFLETMGSFTGAADTVMGLAAKQQALTRGSLENAKLQQQLQYDEAANPLRLDLARETLASKFLSRVLQQYGTMQSLDALQTQQVGDATFYNAAKKFRGDFDGLYRPKNAKVGAGLDDPNIVFNDDYDNLNLEPTSSRSTRVQAPESIRGMIPEGVYNVGGKTRGAGTDTLLPTLSEDAGASPVADDTGDSPVVDEGPDAGGDAATVEDALFRGEPARESGRPDALFPTLNPTSSEAPSDEPATTPAQDYADFGALAPYVGGLTPEAIDAGTGRQQSAPLATRQAPAVTSDLPPELTARRPLGPMPDSVKMLKRLERLALAGGGWKAIQQRHPRELPWMLEARDALMEDEEGAKWLNERAARIEWEKDASQIIGMIAVSGRSPKEYADVIAIIRNGGRINLKAFEDRLKNDNEMDKERAKQGGRLRDFSPLPAGSTSSNGVPVEDLPRPTAIQTALAQAGETLVPRLGKEKGGVFESTLSDVLDRPGGTEQAKSMIRDAKYDVAPTEDQKKFTNSGAALNVLNNGLDMLLNFYQRRPDLAGKLKGPVAGRVATLSDLAGDDDVDALRTRLGMMQADYQRAVSGLTTNVDETKRLLGQFPGVTKTKEQNLKQGTEARAFLGEQRGYAEQVIYGSHYPLLREPRPGETKRNPVAFPSKEAVNVALENYQLDEGSFVMVDGKVYPVERGKKETKKKE